LEPIRAAEVHLQVCSWPRAERAFDALDDSIHPHPNFFSLEEERLWIEVSAEPTQCVAQNERFRDGKRIERWIEIRGDELHLGECFAHQSERRGHSNVMLNRDLRHFLQQRPKLDLFERQMAIALDDTLNRLTERRDVDLGAILLASGQG